LTEAATFVSVTKRKRVTPNPEKPNDPILKKTVQIQKLLKAERPILTKTIVHPILLKAQASNH
jgi:hypothetical protein